MDFGAAGTWLRRSAVWSLLNPLSAKSLAVFPEFGRNHDDVVIDFGAGVGLWAWLGDDSWLALSALSPTATALFDVDNNGEDDVVFNFPGYGIWWFNGSNGTWGGQLHPANASSFVSLDLGAGGKKLVVDFPGFGLWAYSAGVWQPLNQPDVTAMITTDLDGNGIDDLVVNFPTWRLGVKMNGTVDTDQFPPSGPRGRRSGRQRRGGPGNRLRQRRGRVGAEEPPRGRWCRRQPKHRGRRSGWQRQG
jgi:hypothetical protein